MEKSDPRLAELLANDDWMRALAHRLTRDEHEAEDVAQETWVRAMTRPPVDPRSARHWFRRVARNLTFNRRRSDEHRSQRERAAARREPLPSVAEMKSHEETRARVASAVFSLEEPYRTVILYRYFRGIGPAEIAEHLGVSVAAVESRLRRGLDQLRARLDRDYGDRAGWVTALLPFLGSSSFSGAAAGGVAASALAGAITMSMKIKIILAIGLALGVTYTVWPRKDRTRPPEAATKPADVSRPMPEEPRAGRSGNEGPSSPVKDANQAASEAPVRTPVVGPQPASPGPVEAEAPVPVYVLEGQVDASQGPRDGIVAIQITGITGGMVVDRGQPVAGSSAIGVPFQIDLSPILQAQDATRADLVELDVRFDHPWYLPSVHRVNLSAAKPDSESASRRVIRLSVRLHPAGGLTGVERGPEGLPVPDAEVAVFAVRNERPLGRSVDATRSDNEGRYRLRVGAGSSYLVAAVDREQHRPAFLSVAATPGGDTFLSDLVLNEGAEISGTIRVAGVPVEKAGVRADHPMSGTGSYYSETIVEARVVSGQTTDRTVRLELGGRIRIAVRDREGRFLHRACRLVGPDGLPVKRWFRLFHVNGGWTASTNMTDRNGPVETYPPLSPGLYRVEFLADQHRVEKAVSVRVEAGKTSEVTWKQE